MKVIIQTDFLCSYFYHAAKNSSEQIPKHKLPHSLYHSLSALIMWQCVFESYANFQIRRHRLQAYPVRRRNGQRIWLEKASIKEKWIHLPIARCGKHFVLNKQPFKNFAGLVDIRNDLVHFDEEVLKLEKETPTETMTVGAIREWIRSGDFFAGSVYDDAICYALGGESVVERMFREYSKLTGDPLPDFLSGQEVVLKVITK